MGFLTIKSHHFGIICLVHFLPSIVAKQIQVCIGRSLKNGTSDAITGCYH